MTGPEALPLRVVIDLQFEEYMTELVQFLRIFFNAKMLDILPSAFCSFAATNLHGGVSYDLCYSRISRRLYSRFGLLMPRTGGLTTRCSTTSRVWVARQLPSLIPTKGNGESGM